MNVGWLPIAIAAQFIIGSSAIFDKLLLKQRAIEPRAYTFWFGLLGAFSILLLPFGFQPTPPVSILLALLGGMAFVGAAYFHFWALERIEASETLPLIGAISPVFTLILSTLLLTGSLGRLDYLGFALLIASGCVLFLAERRFTPRGAVGAIVASAVLLALSHVISKIVFLETSFITGFFWLKMGGVLAALGLLLPPRARRAIAAAWGNVAPRSRARYVLNRGYAAAGSLLVSGAIFLSNPALVDATQNLRYLVIFALGWLMLRERFHGRILAAKISASILIAAGLLSLAGGEYVRSLPPVSQTRHVQWGVTFSQKFAGELGLDWRENYRAILDELAPQRLRLVAYWDLVEPAAGAFDFADLDWQVREASRRNVPVIVALGLRLPRWPECHAPDWSHGLSPAEREERVRRYIAAVVERYRREPAVLMWQVENEPYLFFGQCPRRGHDFLEKEIAAVRALDSRPILTTDGGELGLWAKSARQGDMFGTTMYRRVYPRFIGPLVGVIEYPLDPAYFRVKAQIVRWWNGRPEQRFIVSELQGEPWEPRSLAVTPPLKAVENFSPAYFSDTIAYAKSAGFEEYYLWGAEWWYWMRERHGDDRYWEIARALFREQ